MCFHVPAAAAAITTVVWMGKKDSKLWQLNLLLYGAALFGAIDHLWNGEFFLVSAQPIKDYALGAVITLGVVGVWKLLIFQQYQTEKKSSK